MLSSLVAHGATVGATLYTQRGSRIRWYPPSHYLPEQLESAASEALRKSWREANPALATVVARVVACPRSRGDEPWGRKAIRSELQGAPRRTPLLGSRFGP